MFNQPCMRFFIIILVHLLNITFCQYLHVKKLKDLQLTAKQF